MATVDVPSPVSQQPDHEVIDVDAFEEDEVSVLGFSVGPHASRGSGSFRAVGGRGSLGTSSASAITVESDDEADLPRVIGSSNTAQRRLLSPPPRPVHPRYVPPVPPIPHHLAGQGSFPAHLRHSPALPPSIRPNARPFAFENHIRHHHPRVSTPPAVVPPLPAATRSHHQPVMGLGGALIALNRQNVIEEANRQREEEARSQRQPNERGFRRLLRPFMNFWRQDSEPLPPVLPRVAAAEIFPNGILLNEPLDGVEDLEYLRELLENHTAGQGILPRYPAGRGRTREQYYQPTYTHPEKATPGFTFDFTSPEISHTPRASSPIVVLDDEEPLAGSSKASEFPSFSETIATLVCAHCNDPLSLTAESAAAEDELARQRVWALRCGHMFDGKCIQEFMRPPQLNRPVSTPDEQEVQPDPKRKAKVVVDDDLDMDVNGVHISDDDRVKMKVSDRKSAARKGKRKAASMLHPEGASLTPDTCPPHAEPEENSIRSRLRPRNPRPTSNTSTLVASQPVTGVPPPLRPVRSLPRRRQGPATGTRARGKGKGKGKARQTVDAVHEWSCPVAGCGHPHASVCIDGEWKMDAKKGAICLFI